MLPVNADCTSCLLILGSIDESAASNTPFLVIIQPSSCRVLGLGKLAAEKSANATVVFRSTFWLDLKRDSMVKEVPALNRL